MGASRWTRDGPGMSLQLVPGVEAVVDESMEVIQHAVREAQLSRMNCQTFSCGGSARGTSERDDGGDVVGHHELAGEMPLPA